jgi:hypothetical protein
MMNITKLYQQLQEGKTTRDYFIREARRQFPQFVSPVTSFTDAVSILKGKRILSENDALPSDVYQELIDTIADKANGDTKAEYDFTIEALKDGKLYNEDHLKGLYKFAVGANYHSIADAVNDILTGKVSLEEVSGPFWDAPPFDDAQEYNDNWADKKVKIVSGRHLGRTGVVIGAENGQIDVKLNAPTQPVVTFSEDEVKIIEDTLQEAQKLDTYQTLDRLPAYAVKKGIEFELAKIGDMTDEALEKAKKRVAAKLKKNPSAYDDQIVSNSKKIEKSDKHLEAKEIKQELVDNKNKMVKPKGFAAEKANTKTSNKENKKGTPKGVKVMKEDVLSHLKSYIAENIGRAYHVGMEVITPDGPGMVKEVIGSTLTVEIEGKDMVKDYQFNIINKHMDEANEPQPEESTHYDEAEETKKEEGKYSGMTYEEKAKLVLEKIKAIKDEGKKAKIMEILYQKKTRNAKPGEANPNPPVSLNPSNATDQRTINDPDFRANYERVKR